ncbi:unnamed protein product [Didymodactylos carnosus]|uniref:Reverse transcriptase domain-containing protein n=1 Tax=Didymodactylos carnosus TaxID=1234261 RepID=A0A8S2FZU0_9BILA|nr:unnamed protein product [Didymodactylos carnosus]CAF4401867.1 unnamed protein product [Didymodactylos carnosus]
MGLSLSPLLADIVIQNFINKNWNHNKYPYKYLGRYVDDFILISSLSKSQVGELVDDMNSIDRNKNIKFTFEFEIDHKLPFLDVMIHLDNGILKTSWYRKPMANSQLLDYKSNHNYAIKTNIVNNMTDRVLAANNYTVNHDDINKLEQILLNSHYPNNIKNKIMKRVRLQQHNSGNATSDLQKVDKPRAVVVVPYLNNMTEKLKYTLNKYNVKLYVQHQRNFGSILNKSKFIARNESKLKTVGPSPINCIYGLKCECREIYVGESNDYERRQQEHRDNIDKVNEGQNPTSLNSLLAEHYAIGDKCLIDFNHPVIYDNEENKWRRKRLESVYTLANRGYNNKLKMADQWAPLIDKWVEKDSGGVFDYQLNKLDQMNDPKSHNLRPRNQINYRA